MSGATFFAFWQTVAAKHLVLPRQFSLGRSRLMLKLQDFEEVDLSFGQQWRPAIHLGRAKEPNGHQASPGSHLLLTRCEDLILRDWFWSTDSLGRAPDLGSQQLSRQLAFCWGDKVVAWCRRNELWARSARNCDWIRRLHRGPTLAIVFRPIRACHHRSVGIRSDLCWGQVAFSLQMRPPQ